MKDTFSAKGRVHLKIYNANGDLLSETLEDNLIVNLGRASMASLLGAATAGKRIANIGFGTDSSPAVGANTTLTSSYTKPIDGVTYSGSTAQFAYSLGLIENNGVTLREFGLFCLDDTLFSRIVRNPIEKTSDIRLEGTWSITF
jgi:hypothetical protein